MEVLKYFHYTSFKTSDNGGMKRLHLLYVPLMVITGSSKGIPQALVLSSLPAFIPAATLSSPMALRTIYVVTTPTFIYFQRKASPKLQTHVSCCLLIVFPWVSNRQLQIHSLFCILPHHCSWNLYPSSAQAKNFGVSLTCTFSGSPSKI